ncbi:MAG: hypothetical protein ACRBBQ_01950 [Cognatishimia sp.]
MFKNSNFRDIAVGVIGCVFALLTLLVWIPNDIDTGVIDVWRRTVRIGDAMLPSFAALGALVASAVVGVRGIMREPDKQSRIINPFFMVMSLVIFVIGFTLMLYAGPVLLLLIKGEGASYRLMFDTAPWKYVGFVLGGTTIVLSFMALASHRISWRLVFIAAMSTLFIALLYDLPFDNLLLPPNGDV